MSPFLYEPSISKKVNFVFRCPVERPRAVGAEHPPQRADPVQEGGGQQAAVLSQPEVSR